MVVRGNRSSDVFSNHARHTMLGHAGDYLGACWHRHLFDFYLLLAFLQTSTDTDGKSCTCALITFGLPVPQPVSCFLIHFHVTPSEHAHRFHCVLHPFACKPTADVLWASPRIILRRGFSAADCGRSHRWFVPFSNAPFKSVHESHPHSTS